jgi:hypothetical protein
MCCSAHGIPLAVERELLASGVRSESHMTAHNFKVVCAWCNRVVNGAPSGTPVTHTICPTCLDFTIAHRSGIAPDASSSAVPMYLPAGYFGDMFKH